MQRGFWRKIRLSVRWTRRAILILVAATAIALVWFNRVGLPDFVKNPLIEKLRARGIALEFSSLRLRFSRGLVAENVRISSLNISDGPTLSLAEAQLLPDFLAMMRGQLQIRGLIFREGKLVWPLSPTNSIAVENIQSDFRFGPNDTWSVDDFRADFAGARLAFAGDIAHARELRDWDIFHAHKTGAHEWREQLLHFYNTLGKTHYAQPPQLNLMINGDAQDPRSFIVSLAITRGKTRLQLNGNANELALNYHWRIRGAVEPEIVRPFLTHSNAVRGLNHFTLTAPVYLDANIYGTDLESIGANGSLAITNFAVRGEAVDNVSGDFFYTNRVLVFYQAHLVRGSQVMTADQISLDFNNELIWFKNGFSTADARAVGRAIGPKVGRLLDPYRFTQPPTVRVNGCAPLKDTGGVRSIDAADLSFDIIKGGEFQCLKLHAQTVTGTIHWLGERLVLTNVVAQLYGGSGEGFAFFDFSTEHEGGDYQCTAAVSKLNLHQLAADLGSTKGNLEGQLSGHVIVTHGDTRDFMALNGFGHANLHDGQLWDVRIFGIFSPILNALSPGVNLGNNRATDAGGHFTITNGMIYTDSLKIDSTTARLLYSGSVDLKGNNVNAIVTAEVLHNTPVIGPFIAWIMSPFSELFTYKVTGTLKEPKMLPLYVPKELMHPIKSIEGKEPPIKTSTTNAPASNPTIPADG